MPSSLPRGGAQAREKEAAVNVGAGKVEETLENESPEKAERGGIALVCCIAPSRG